MTSDERLSLIEKDLSYLIKFIDEDRKKMQEHIVTSDKYRNKVIELSKIEKELDAHITTDRWMFGTIITILVCVLGAIVRILVKF